MNLSRFDLGIIKRALKLLTKVEDGVFSKEILASTKQAVVDILSEYPNATMFLIEPDKSEE